MVNVLAAIGVAQMETLPNFILTKRKNFQLYVDALDENLPCHLHGPSAEEESNFWFYPLLLDKGVAHLKEKLMSFLEENGIGSRPLWALMESLPMYNTCEKSDLSVS